MKNESEKERIVDMGTTEIIGTVIEDEEGRLLTVVRSWTDCDAHGKRHFWSALRSATEEEISWMQKTRGK